MARLKQYDPTTITWTHCREAMPEEPRFSERTFLVIVGGRVGIAFWWDGYFGQDSNRPGREVIQVKATHWAEWPVPKLKD